MWRFAGNEDKESLDNINNGEVNDENIRKYSLVSNDLGMELVPCETQSDEKKAVEPDTILSRRDNKKLKIKEYEVKWTGKSEEMTMWVKRDILIKMGGIKLVQRQDEKRQFKQV